MMQHDPAELHRKTHIIRVLNYLNDQDSSNESLREYLLDLCPLCSKYLQGETGVPSQHMVGVSLEWAFGVFLILCGVLAATANLMILVAVGRHLINRNVLFLIITNFAIIDEFKALCAIYMGSVLMSVSGLKSLPQQDSYLVVFKMLQTSVFMMYFGNLCSVFNLILATINEFLCIKLPLQYKHWVTKFRVLLAIMCTWVLALLFSMAKALHSGGGADGWSNILVPIHNNSMSDQSQWSILRAQNTATSTDVYALILLASLLCCLVVVSIVYLSLYLTIRRSVAFRKKVSVHCGPPNKVLLKKSMNANFASLADSENGQVPSRKPSKPINETNRPTTVSNKSLPKYKRTVSFTLSHGSQRNKRQKDRKCSALSLGPNEYADPLRALELVKRPPMQRLGAQVSLLKRHRTVLVILVVCLVNFVYLTIYFSLQLLHVLHIRKGVTAEKLQQRYVVNFLLRALFVLHASLNPIIFFRIRSFRTTFQSMFFSCRRRLPGQEDSIKKSSSFDRQKHRVIKRQKRCLPAEEDEVVEEDSGDYVSVLETNV